MIRFLKRLAGIEAGICLISMFGTRAVGPVALCAFLSAISLFDQRDLMGRWLDPEDTSCA